MRTPSILALTLVLSACIHGTQLKDFRPAHTPEGARVTIRLEGQNSHRTGELFAVDSAGIFLMSGGLIHVRFDRLQVIDFAQFRAPYDVFDGKFGSEQRTQMARVSRFPQGLDAPMLARVLSALGQPSVQEVP